MKGFSSKHVALKIDVTGPENTLFCKRVSASFSPEILQAGALRGLIKTENLALLKQNADHLCLNMAISTAVTVTNCSACKITGKASFALKVHWGENDKGR